MTRFEVTTTFLPLQRIVHVTTTLTVKETEVQMVTLTISGVTTTTSTLTTWHSLLHTLPPPVHTSLVVVEEEVEKKHWSYGGGLEVTPPSPTTVYTTVEDCHSDYFFH